MASGHVNLVLLALSVVCLSGLVSCSDNVPVFMWGDVDEVSSSKANPLQTVSYDEFDNVFRKAAANKFVVVFTEETLSVEDFRLKNSDGSSSFEYLHDQLDNALYLPSVDAPLGIINKDADLNNAERINLADNSLTAETRLNGNYLVIDMKDAKTEESRADMLKRHDEFMSEMVDKLQGNYGKVLAVYTAHYPSWAIAEIKSRSKRQAAISAPYFQLENVLLILNNATVSKTSGDATDLGAATAVVQDSGNETDIMLTVTFTSGTAKFHLTKSAGYWFLSEIMYDDEVLDSGEIYAKMDYSYSCNTETKLKNGNTTFAFKGNFQIEPFFNATKAQFGSPYYCTGFFSVPIWSGLFIVFLLLIITFYGACMIMDINTNDRYDDPKGKTITVTANE